MPQTETPDTDIRGCEETDCHILSWVIVNTVMVMYHQTLFLSFMVTRYISLGMHYPNGPSASNLMY